MAMIPHGGGTDRQRYRNALEQIAETVRTDGKVVVEAVYRYDGGEWNTVTGEVSAGRNGLIWKDVDNNVIPWPPQTGEIYEIKNIFQAAVTSFNTMMSNTSRVAEEGIQAAVGYANQGTDYIINAASTTLAQQVDEVNARQEALHASQAQHFAQFQTARNTIEEERLQLARWESTLQAREKDMERLEADSKKAQGAEKTRLEKEIQTFRAKAEKDRKEIEEERAELNELMGQAERRLGEARAARREAEKKRIKALLTPQTAPLTPQQHPSLTSLRPTLTAFPAPPHRQRQQARRQPKNHITIVDDDDDEDDDDDTFYDEEEERETCRSFATARSQRGRHDFIVESDTFALDPTAWKERLSPSIIDRTLSYLRHSANVKNNHWSEHILDDLLRILRGLMFTAQSIPALLDGEPFLASLRTILKRIFIFRETSLGHGGSYIKALSEAVDGADRPSWILNAQRQARKDALASASPHPTKSSTQKKATPKAKN